ncbi:hypothetical protein CRUP_001475 [Coryphaenoides rupestris]|nr:hypothetical protein CRUP_001475 [Coryphaenoides rupestris]
MLGAPKSPALRALGLLLLAGVLVEGQPPPAGQRMDEQREGVWEEEEEEEEEVATVTVATGVALCPPECSCAVEGVVDCAGTDLTAFPEEISPNTWQLSLQNNQIQEVTLLAASLSRLARRLQTQLNLPGTKLADHPSAHLGSETLASLPGSRQLQLVLLISQNTQPPERSVYLHNNKLTDSGLPDNMFNGSSSLEILIMSSNFLHLVPSHLPSSLHRLHLKCLDLSNNNLTVVPSGLPRSLILLHLEKNFIREIPRESMSSVRNLEYLLLHNNRLRSRSIHPMAFQGLKKLHTIHMYNNLLERVPRGLPRRAKTLMMLHNAISEIGRNDLVALYTLTELNLSYNRLTTGRLHREAFRKLRLLETLDLSGNGLQALPLGLPRSLRALRVKNNQLSSVPDGALAGMDKLTEINLSNNLLKLNSVYQGAWMELGSLTSLDLSGNQLSHIPSDLPESLEYLHLSSNRISSVPPSAFQGTPNLKGLYLRWKSDNNQIQEVTVDQLSRLPRLEDEGFEDMQQLSYLYLANNRLTKIYPYTFGEKPSLKSVYLHNNKLTDSGLPDNMFNGSSSLEILIMSSNFLHLVPSHLPSSLHRLHLKCLDLSNNNLTVVPSGLPRSLILLHLEKNYIREIPRESMSSVRNLEYLLLHNNRLRSRSIHPMAFQGLKKLHTIHMYNNLLERVPRGLPRRAKTLMMLHNAISEIGRNDLVALYTLTELNLSYNRLTTGRLHREAFRKLRLLETLDLSGNGLQALPLGLPRSLRALRVKNNQLSSVPDGALAGMDKLTEINLSNNLLKLNSVYQGAWMELGSLTSLDLSGNQLSHIPSDLPESLEYLHLSSNRISSVPPSAFQGTPNLKGLYLRSESRPFRPGEEEEEEETY